MYVHLTNNRTPLTNVFSKAIPSIVQTTLTLLNKPPATPALKLAALDVMVTVVFYNPSLALHTLESMPGGSRTFFDKWFGAAASEAGLPRVHDKKLSILTLCELLKLDPSVVPPSLRDGWNGLVGGILSIFKTLPDAQARTYHISWLVEFWFINLSL